MSDILQCYCQNAVVIDGYLTPETTERERERERERKSKYMSSKREKMAHKWRSCTFTSSTILQILRNRVIIIDASFAIPTKRRVCN